MTTPLLDVANLGVHYGGVPAVRDLSFSVNTGEVVALLGANGAGKTSTLSAIMGMLGSQQGTVTFDGAPITGKTTDAIARSGIALVPEGRNIFGDLTVDENLRLGMMGRESSAQAELDWTLELFPILREFSGRAAGLLSGGQQQQLAIGRALVSAPKLLMLDEPSLGLAPTIVDAVFDALDQVRQHGTTIVIVEQRATRTAAFADRSHILSNGALHSTVTADTPELEAVITAAYFGS